MDSHRGHGAEPDRPDKPDKPVKPGEHSGCAAFGPLLEAYYHHALTPEQAQSVAEHAAGCAQCRTALADFAEIDRLIAAAPAPQPGPELRRRVTARIATARAQRPANSANLAGPAASLPFERNAVVSDMRDMHDMHDMETTDTPWARTGTRAAPAVKRIQRLRVLLGTAAAVLIVGLIAGALLTRPHGPGVGTSNLVNTPTPVQANQAGTATPDQGNYANSAQFTPAAGKCSPGKISASIPAHALLFDLAMVSPNEGWAVGAIESPTGGNPVNALILRYQDCAWTPVTADYPGMTLMSVSMTSATEGWAVGGSSDGKQLALHYTGGAWQPVTLPGENSFDGGYTIVRMLGADEGWIVTTHRKNSQGIAVDSLLHLTNGHWTEMDSAITSISDLLPIGPNEAWMAGTRITNAPKPVLYHFQAGAWAESALPSGVVVDRLRMTSPRDIWASGHINAPSNVDYEQSAAVLRYDGSSWQKVNMGASGHPQFIQAFDANARWAFTIDTDMSADTVNGAQYQRNGTWLRVKWPFKADMSMGLVPFGMSPMQRVSADEYWSIGVMNPTGGQQGMLLYFANGAWHAYGQ